MFRQQKKTYKRPSSNPKDQGASKPLPHGYFHVTVDENATDDVKICTLREMELKKCHWKFSETRVTSKDHSQSKHPVVARKNFSSKKIM